MLVGIVRHLQQPAPSAAEDAELDLDYVNDGVFTESWSSRLAKYDFGTKCDCIKCQPEENSFGSEVYIWDWSQKHARKILDLEETVCTIRHASVKSVPGSAKFNAVFSDVPVAIGATLGLTPASAGTFRWACGTDLVSVYESHIEDSIDPSTTALKTTGALQRHVPYALRCSVTAEHLLWLDAKQLLVVAVRGRATLRWGCFYGDCAVSANAVDFEGCVLLFTDHGAELVCSGSVREHSSISKL